MNQGWAFLAAVTRAIEAWSADVVRQAPAAFFYRGADLRHAVERTLFFRLVNDAGLQRHFGDITGGRPAPPPDDPWCAVIARYLSPQPGAMPHAASRLPARSWKKRA